MTSPAFGIGYSLWLRLRWAIAGIVFLMLVLALLVQLFPDTAPYFCGASIVIVFISLAFVLNVFSFGPADLGVKSSGFPAHMRVLPASNRALVGWPMLFAAATCAMIWAVPSCLIFLPAGFPLPVLWPATMLAALCVWIQAVGWSPMPSPFARVPLLLVALTPLMLPLALGLTFFKGPVLTPVVCASCLAWSFAAYLFGVQGVSRARIGSEGDWFRAIVRRWDARARQRQEVGSHQRPFRSPLAAHLWYECRRNAIVMPIMTAFVGLPMLLMMSLPILSGARQQSFLFGSTTVTPAMMTLALWATLPIIFALTQGAIAKFDIWGKTAMPAFFATRPMTTSQFVFIKLCTVAVSSVGSWAVSFGLFTVWAAIEASSLNSHPSLIRDAWASATPRSAAIMFFILVGLVAMTWRNTASGLWTIFLGRKYLSNSIGFAYMAAYTMAGLAGIWIYKHPQYHQFLSTLVPWFVGALVLLKLGVALCLSLALQGRGLIEPKTMRLLAAGWLLMFGCLLGGLSLLTSPTWGLAAIVVFVLPFPSLAASPLALEWNRHR